MPAKVLCFKTLFCVTLSCDGRKQCIGEIEPHDTIFESDFFCNGNSVPCSNCCRGRNGIFTGAVGGIRVFPLTIVTIAPEINLTVDKVTFSGIFIEGVACRNNAVMKKRYKKSCRFILCL